MSGTIKKKVSDTSYSINRLYRKISTFQPSPLVLSAITIAIAVFLFGGGIYNVIVQPYPAYVSQGRFVLVDPRFSEQLLSDSLVSMVLYSLGIIGVMIMYQSTQYASKPRQAYMMFMAGVILLLIAYIFLEATISVKLSR